MNDNKRSQNQTKTKQLKLAFFGTGTLQHLYRCIRHVYIGIASVFICLVGLSDRLICICWIIGWESTDVLEFICAHLEWPLPNPTHRGDVHAHTFTFSKFFDIFPLRLQSLVRSASSPKAFHVVITTNLLLKKLWCWSWQIWAGYMHGSTQIMIKCRGKYAFSYANLILLQNRQ